MLAGKHRFSDDLRGNGSKLIPLNSFNISPAGIYLLKANRNTKTRCEICSKLTKKDTKMTHAIGAILVSLLLTLNIFHALF